MNETATAKDGVFVSIIGNNMVRTSKGEFYMLSGGYLNGPGMRMSKCGSVSEAFGMVLGMHGGRRL